MTIIRRRAAIDQIGLVTTDLDRAVAQWTSRFGIGPWTIYRNVELTGTCRGTPTQVRMDVALGYRGGEQIEFIQVTSDTPSPYQDEAGHPIAGMHHLAWIVDDLEAEAAALTAAGLVPVFRAGNAAVQVIYLADPGGDGVMFELICGATMRADHAAGVAAAMAWDGKAPNLEIDLAAVS